MDLYNRFTSPGGKGNPLTGGAIAASDSISPNYLVHHITGTGVVKVINLPYPEFNGPIYLVSDDGFSFDASGNIGTPAGTVPAKGVLPFLYDLSANKWYTLAVGLIPFTLVTGLTAQVPITIFAADFIASAGGYSTFTISKTQGGPYTASIDFGCVDLGVQTVYVLGTKGSKTLEVSGTVTIEDNMGYCTP